MFKKKQKMKKVLSLIMTLALIVFDLSGVIGGQTVKADTMDATNVTVTGVTLDKAALALEIGKTAPLVETIAPLEATNKNVNWSSDNAAVATVANGVVTAVTEGTANITVTTEDQAKTSLCVVTVTANAPPASKTFDIIEVTDFHGALLSSDATPLPVGSVLAKNLKNAKAANPDRTIIIGGGDLYQGSPISNVLRGVPVQKAFSNIGMEVTGLGNHEFDWGLDTIVNTTMKDAAYSIVAANLYNKNTDGTKGTRKFAPYKIIEKDGVKIAFVGAITNETKDIVMPAFIKDYIFTDVATEVNACAAEIKAANTADVIVAIIHEGNNVTAPTTGEIFNITNKLTNVNAVFGGHSHTIVTAAGTNGIPIYLANSSGKGYIDAKMTVQTDGNVSFAPPTSADYKAIDTTAVNGYKIGNPNLKPGDAGYVAGTPVQDPEVKAIIDAAIAEVGPTFSEVIGNAAMDLTRTQIGTPFGESILGNWSSDVVKTSAKADIGIQNNGGLRSNINAGPITVGNIFYFMPFDNEINTVLVTKAQLKVILEQAVRDGGKGLQISGIKFTYNSTATTGSRVFNITREDGKAISDTETLKLAGPDFILTGGDGFAGFLDANVSKTMVKTGVLVRDALLANVRENKGINYVLNTRLQNLSNIISVVATSDVHGNLLNFDYGTNAAPSKSQGIAKVSTYVKGLRSSNSNTMLIDNGDMIQGTPLVYYYNMIDKTTAYPTSAVMGEMGYDTWTLGNHEFNYGLDTLNRIMTEAKAKNIHVLSANTYKTDNSNFVEPYTIKSFVVNGKTIKVGILGLTTKTIASWEDPTHFAGLHFNDLVDEAKKWVPKVREAGADVVILAAHSGLEGAADTIPENQIGAIAKSVNGIDAIVAGHVHNVVNNNVDFKNPEGKVVPIVEPGKWAQNVSQIDIAVDANGKFTGLTTKNVAMDNTIAEDPAITSLIAPYQAKTLEYTSTVLGQSTGEYSGAKQITEPTEIMELINKVQMSAAGTQLSIAAPLSLKAYIPSGDITIKDIMGVYIYENFMYGVKMNGKQLKDWMEYTARYYKQVVSSTDPIVADYTIESDGNKKQNIADYNLDQLYGATYDIDLTQPAGTIDPVTKKMATGNRIKNLKFNGKLVKDSDVFTVAINNYRYNGGGGFMAAAGISNTDASLVTYDSAKALGDDGQVRSLMMKYVQDNKTITPSTSNNWKISTSLVQQQVDVTGVSLNRTSATMKIAGTLNLIATVSPANATSKNVRFTSSNPAVATVSGTGLVKAVNGGKATITATTIDGGFIATCDITVIVPVTGVKLNKTSATIKNTDTLKLIATIMPVNATNKAVSFTSSNPAVATVSADGVVKAVTAGKTTITVTTADGKFTATCKVTVIVPVTGISLQKTYLSIKPKMSETLKVTLLPSNATNKKLVWKSSNVLVATVDGNGKVTAHKAGLAKISVTTVDGNFKAECIVAVSNTLATQVKINKSALTVKVGKEANLLTLLGARNVDSKYVTWTCDSSLIKVIVKNGKLISVSGKAVGNAKITVTSLDGKYITVYKVNIIK